MTGQQVIPEENGIVWLEDPEGLVYVREVIDDMADSRDGEPYNGSSARIVGYSTLAPETEPHEDTLLTFGVEHFTRRIFTVAPWDPYPGCPTEAVDPTSVRPGEPSTPMGFNYVRFDERQRLVGAEPWKPTPEQMEWFEQHGKRGGYHLYAGQRRGGRG